MENNTPIISSVADRENIAKHINIYATLGVSLIVIIAIAAFTAAVFVLGSSLSQSYSSSASAVILFGYFVATPVIFLTVPALLNARYGWRTVTATYLAQSLLLFVALTALALIFSSAIDPAPTPIDTYPTSNITY